MLDATHILNDELIQKCMHCGLCLPSCPTYALTGLEKSSPRGRIRMMKAVSDGEMAFTDGFVNEMNFCLDCQACETACPAGVQFGILVESSRDQISKHRVEPWITRVLKRFLLAKLFANRKRITFVAKLLWFYQVSGLDRCVKKSGLLRLLSEHVHEIQFLVPRVARISSSRLIMNLHRSTAKTEYRIGFLTGCIMDVAFADVNLDTVELLTHHGCEVVTPKAQKCCGSLLAHNGDFDTAKDFARENVRAFSGLDLDAIVMNSAGCGAFMRQYGVLLKEDPEYAAPAEEVAEKVRDISEFLFETGFQANGNSRNPYRSKRVTYHDACHLVHSQRIGEQPRKLIKSVPELEYVELPESTWCCGSAGIYNITHFDEASLLLDRKISNVRKINPDVIVTGNPGCMLQIGYGLRKAGMKTEIVHLATFLRRVCCA